MQIAFFPWLRLTHPIALGPFTFVPFKDDLGHIAPALADVAESLNTILRGYVDMRGASVGNCVVVTHARSNPVWDLRDEDHELIIRYAKILTLCAFAKNDYNTNMGCYANSSHFQFVRQRFTVPVDYIAFDTRRRDGSTTDGGYRHGEVRFPVPPQAKSSRDACIDTGLGTAIARAISGNSPTAQSLLAALLFFDLANTDTDVMQLEAEVILMGSAFEQLLGTYGERRLNQAVG
ncbi:MAG TPA: hypothetical protein VE422_23965 [Terriglobia bacterium]|nr:hypothetical protein [Terriglobia bacterium]